MSTNDWLQQLKSGDAVIEDHAGRRSLASVARVTPTQIVLSDRFRYRKSDGGLIGGNIWPPSMLREATPEAIALTKAQARKQALVANLRSMAWNKLPLETLESVAALLPKPTSVS